MKIFVFKKEKKCLIPACGPALDTTDTYKCSTALSQLCASAFPPEASGYQPQIFKTILYCTPENSTDI